MTYDDISTFKLRGLAITTHPLRTSSGVHQTINILRGIACNPEEPKVSILTYTEMLFVRTSRNTNYRPVVVERLFPLSLES